VSDQQPPKADEPSTEATPAGGVQEPAPFAPPRASDVPPAELESEPVPPAPEPTPTVSAAEASWSRPAGSAAQTPTSAPTGDALADRPEVLVGAAFAGGFVAALFLKRLGR
jgi:hypothetical protein